MKYLFSLILLLGFGFVNGQGEVARIDSMITYEGIKSHISFLSSDALRGRNTGTQGLEAAAAYISSHFIRHGVSSPYPETNYYQYVKLEQRNPPDSSSVQVNEKVVNFPSDFVIMQGDTRQMTSQAVYVEYGMPEDYGDKDVKLKIAVALCGTEDNPDVNEWLKLARQKRKWARDAGAVGLIEIYRSAFVPWQNLVAYMTRPSFSLSEGDHTSGFSHLWLGSSDKELIKELTQESPRLAFDLKGVQKEQILSPNVIGVIEGTDPDLKDEYIIYTAHYDHVGVGNPDFSQDSIYNGARDNAVGTSAVLALGEYFTAFRPRRSVILALFTAEEKGLLGSHYFADNPPVELEHIKYCLNIDNSGYNDTSKVTVIGLNRTDAGHMLAAAAEAYGLEAIDDPAKEQNLFNRSDNVNFARKGIPAPSYGMGFTEFNQEIMKYYHRPGDELETLDLEYILKYIRSFILAADKVANTKDSLFWTEGDYYFDAGIELYRSNPN